MLPENKLFILLILFFYSVTALAPQDASEYEKRLNKIVTQINSLKSKIEKETKRESSVLSRLSKLGLQKNLLKNEISYFNTVRERTSSELSGIQKRISELQTELDKKKDSIAKILAALYKFGNFNYLDLLLHADKIDSLLSQNKNLTLLAQHEEQIITGYLKTLQELSSSKETLAEKKSEIEQLIQKSAHKQQEFLVQEKNHRDLIKEIAQNKQIYLQTMRERIERAEELQKLLKNLLENKLDLPFTIIPLYEKKGQLPWPFSGKIVTKFGNIRHPRYNTITASKGIEISPQDDLLVKAIHPGIVLFSDYLPGFGNLILIDHGMSYYSLYGHCSEALVKKEDVVTAGNPIAYVGDIGSMKGTTLHFEIRFKTKPLNPLQWLKRR